MTEPVSPDQPIEFGTDGLIPAVIQDAVSDRVVMVGFMNRDAFDATRATMRVHFWSRSRKRLWKKGETSGHEFVVEEIFVNCERNSLLVTVHQLGAGCHDGYSTCYYRRLEADGSLTIVQERAFDPADIYDQTDGETFADRTRRWYGAYRYLIDHDLSNQSATSKRLRDPSAQIHNRVADELIELAGVLRGEHRHADPPSDTLLEASQTLYWLALMATKADVPWEALRPDRALTTASDELSMASAASLLLAEATAWTHGPGDPSTLSARCHAAMALVAQACRSVGVSPGSLIRRDLDELQAKPYLADYFAAGYPNVADLAATRPEGTGLLLESPRISDPAY